MKHEKCADNCLRNQLKGNITGFRRSFAFQLAHEKSKNTVREEPCLVYNQTKTFGKMFFIRQITRKYVQPPHLPGMIYSGVRPGAAKKEKYESWRIDQLSKQIPRLRVRKYAGPPPYKISNVHPTTLTGQPGTWRTPELANQNLRSKLPLMSLI